MKNVAFEKTLWNMRKNINMKFVITGKTKNYLVSEPNSHATNFFTENLLAIVIRKTQMLMNKPVYLDLSKLDLSISVVYEFCYD